jgi:uncharacterized membrane protein YeaQ/YmgE (transglycosylase-associated protein family)
VSLPVPTALLWWLGIGLLVGILGRLLLPGGDRGLLSVFMALVGALLGGVLATVLGVGGLVVVDPAGLVLVGLCAVLALLALRLVQGRRA